MKSRWVIAIVVSISCWSASVRAQNGKKWTLEECIAYAAQNNLQIKFAGLPLETSRAALFQSKAALLPTLNGSATHNYNFGRSIDPFTNAFVNQQIQSNNFALSSNMVLFQGFQNRNTIRRNQNDLKANQADLQQTKNDVALNVTSAFMQVLFNKELLQVAREQAKTGREQTERTQKLVQAGSVAEANLLDLVSQSATDELNAVNAENQLELSKLNLQQLLQLSADSTFDVVAPEINIRPENIKVPAAEDVYNTALDNIPSIRAADLRVKTALISAQVARGTLYPRLMLGGNVFTGYSSARSRIRTINGENTGRIFYIRDTTGALLPVPGTILPSGRPTTISETYRFSDQFRDNVSQSFGFTLSLPIFNGWQAHTAVANAVIAFKRAEYNAEQARFDLRQNVEQAQNNLRAALKKYMATQNQLTATRESLRATQRRFEVGLVNIVEFSLARTRAQSSEADFLQAKYDLVFKQKVLDFYMGKALSF